MNFGETYLNMHICCNVPQYLIKHYTSSHPFLEGDYGKRFSFIEHSPSLSRHSSPGIIIFVFPSPISFLFSLFSFLLSPFSFLLSPFSFLLSPFSFLFSRFSFPFSLFPFPFSLFPFPFSLFSFPFSLFSFMFSFL
jgi:hypothetical protein